MTPRKNPANVLVVEDSLSLQTIYRSILTKAGFTVGLAGTAAQAMAIFAEQEFSVVILDLVLPDRDGLTLMQDLLASRPDTVIIVVTANSAVDRAVAAMRGGAHDFLVKPINETRLVTAVESTSRKPARKLPRPAKPALPTPAVPSFIGSSEVMRRLQDKIVSVASSMATVFITGESGTGKELAAVAVHDLSPRASGPFIALNCGAIPEDLLESEVFGHMKGSFTGAISDKPGAATAADGGTLFLDEVCEMALPLQTKLLRFLQTSTVQPVGATRPRKVNVRIVCATNVDPLEAVRLGQFREDLYYRLFVVPIHLPPLRARGDDVIEIAAAALARFADEEGRPFDGLSPQVEQLFRSYSWPGNVRQLLNVLRNVVVLNAGGMVTLGMLPEGMIAERAAPFLPGAPALPHLDVDALIGRTMADIERRVIETTLAHHGGSVSRAARVLDIAPSTLYRKIESWTRQGG